MRLFETFMGQLLEAQDQALTSSQESAEAVQDHVPQGSRRSGARAVGQAPAPAGGSAGAVLNFQQEIIYAC